jgi:hypothetical protein
MSQHKRTNLPAVLTRPRDLSHQAAASCEQRALSLCVADK